MSWDSKIINIDTEDTVKIKRDRGSKSYHQYPIVHEFGHSVGNSIFASTGMHGDEYNSSSSFFRDKRSLMNIGSNLRDRHLDFLLQQLNTMIPNAQFSKLKLKIMIL